MHTTSKTIEGKVRERVMTCLRTLILSAVNIGYARRGVPRDRDHLVETLLDP